MKAVVNVGCMIQKATESDIEGVKSLIDYWAEKNFVLCRSLENLRENIADFWVYKNAENVIGAVSLDIIDSEIAMIRTLCVAPEHRRKGVGTRLVKTAMEEARNKGIKKIGTITKNSGFFKRFGFSTKKTFLSNNEVKAYMEIGTSLDLPVMNFSSISLATSSENC